MQILEYYGLGNTNKWAFVGYEALFFVLFFFLAWLGLRFVRRDKR